MVPSELGNLSALTNLWLNNNSGLSGQLPMSLDTLANLERVRISGTGFTGCIPAALTASDSDDQRRRYAQPADLLVSSETRHIDHEGRT